MARLVPPRKRVVVFTAILLVTAVVLAWPLCADTTRTHFSDGVYDVEFAVLYVTQGVTSGGLLAFFLDPNGRFDGHTPLHIWARRYATCVLLGAYVDMTLPPLGHLLRVYFGYLTDLYLLLGLGIPGWISSVILIDVTLLRLQVVAPGTTAARARCLIKVVLLCLIFFVIGLFINPAMSRIAEILTGIVLTLFQGYVLRHFCKASAAARAALSSAHGGQDAEARDTSAKARASALLLAASFATTDLAALGVVLGIDLLITKLFWVLVDIPFNIFCVLLCSGLVGPAGDRAGDLAEMSRLATIWRERTTGYGVHVAGRVAFEGKVQESAGVCVVSFPGKYATQWDKAVQMARQFLSLACVFLTDTTSGLGQHVDNPEMPGHCYCKQIYGSVPAEAYISRFERSRRTLGNEGYQEGLGFAMADADAMGAILLIKGSMNAEEWQRAQEYALKRAQRRQEANFGRAPWGCKWFHTWKKNVDLAVKSNQKLCVYYFEGKCGCGKVSWDDLANPEVMKNARANTGLGASQTAEVAYLDKMGYAYEERDVSAFEDDCTGYLRPSLETLSVYSL